MTVVEKQTLDEERALYGSKGIIINDCTFDGPADGESAVKEASDVQVNRCFFNLRYPFWHVHELAIHDSEMTALCRAALWYSDHVAVTGTKMHGIKAFRECSDVVIRDCDIVSPEFGWSVRNIEMTDSVAESEYFMMRSEDMVFKNVSLKGKYSFQYIKNAVFENCNFDTKDAFWHGENVVVGIYEGASIFRPAGPFVRFWYGIKFISLSCTVIVNIVSYLPWNRNWACYFPELDI